MDEFTPAISARNTEELIEIANSTNNDWQQNAINQAKTELKKRGITQQQQDTVINLWDELRKQEELDYQKQLKRNETEGYSVARMIWIFFLAPFILLHSWFDSSSLTNLKRENYKRKFKQRLLLLIGGTAFWALYISVEDYVLEKRKLEEIRKINISQWEKTFYGSDSLDGKSK